MFPLGAPAICRGAAGALVFVEFRLDFKLGTSDLSEDATAGTLEDFEDDFGMAAKAMVDILPLKDVIHESSKLGRSRRLLLS